MQKMTKMCWNAQYAFLCNLYIAYILYILQSVWYVQYVTLAYAFTFWFTNRTDYLSYCCIISFILFYHLHILTYYFAYFAYSISRRKDKGRSGGFETRSRGVWVRNPTRSGIGCRDVTMPDRHTMEGNHLFSQRIKWLTQIPGWS